MKPDRSVFLLFIILQLMACTGSGNKKKSTIRENPDFNRLLEEYYQEGLELDPILATKLGDNRYNDQFPNYISDAYRKKEKDYYISYLKEASLFGDEDLSASEQVSRNVLAWECKMRLEGLSFRDDFMPINQMWSVNLLMGKFASGESAQPFNTIRDYKNWLHRVDDYLQWMDTAEKKMKMGIDSGYVLPKSLIVRVIPQIKALANEDVENHLFYSPVKKFPADFSKEEKNSLKSAYKTMVTNKIIPAYKKLADFVSSEYLEAGRESSGYNKLPHGKEEYAFCIKKFTTTNMTADEIYQLGMKEVTRIRQEMEKVKGEVGYEGDLQSFFNYMRNNPELMPYTVPQQVLDHFQDIYNRMKPQLNGLFAVTPKAGFVIKRTEAFREKSASAEYNEPSKDGTRPGIFYVPIPDVTKYNVYSDESLFLHEAIPGHHYQIALTLENEDLPEFRKNLWYSAYGEGWALYTESLGKELGLYTDPFQYFGMLSAEIHRAIRLVVDVGLHAKGWSREQAIQYSLENEAEPEASIISEIERYMANPGQALSYKIGQLKIRELRTKAETALGKNFDIREFHKQVLNTGCVPLAILEKQIDGWIEGCQN
jgi:uncharacterized protein (DUF885 family)